MSSPHLPLGAGQDLLVIPQDGAGGQHNATWDVPAAGSGKLI
jgi:hypothetical protein